ncbi:response regulator [Sulfurimonas sp. SAG-AH-194-I05]|nr:response regulator [Sulfurimonas sp. SAG-AH-194-I05]MDF1875329.1 response regulator [Sulfurimonas sp. SAG-AH-194-I05]
MEFMDSINTELLPLVKEYAREMKLLIVEDQQASVEFYKLIFGKYFQICDVAYDGQEALTMWQKDREYYDLIITDVDMPVMDGITLVKAIRIFSMKQSIIVLTGITDLQKNQTLAYYFIDGLIPKPIDKEKLFILLYRVLKKVSEHKEYVLYTEELENQVNESLDLKTHLTFIIEKLQPVQSTQEVTSAISMLHTLMGHTDISIENKQEIIIKREHAEIDDLSNKHETDLRYSTVDHTYSSSEFIATLDDTIMDKIEDFLVTLDAYVSAVDSMQTQRAEIAIVTLCRIAQYYEVFIEIINNLVIFPIISRAFVHLNIFVQGITVNNLGDAQKSLLISLLLNIEKDISHWIKCIFIDTCAENIYYFDASFSNGAFEIESVFNSFGSELTNNEEFSDDDLGFF